MHFLCAECEIHFQVCAQSGDIILSLRIIYVWIDHEEWIKNPGTDSQKQKNNSRTVHTEKWLT